jgi:hypothetical protein
MGIKNRKRIIAAVSSGKQESLFHFQRTMKFFVRKIPKIHGIIFFEKVRNSGVIKDDGFRFLLFSRTQMAGLFVLIFEHRFCV